MTGFLMRRFVAMIVLLFVISFVTFSLFQLGPADPAAAACGQECTPQRIAEARIALGMDKPFLTQYLTYMSGLLGSHMVGAPGAETLCSWPCLGKSFQTNEDVSTIIERALPYTLSMASGAIVLWTVAGVGLGLLAALRKGRFTDKLIVGAASVGVSLPIPVTGLLLLLLLVSTLNLLPFTTNEIASPFGAAGPGGWFTCGMPPIEPVRAWSPRWEAAVAAALAHLMPVCEGGPVTGARRTAVNTARSISERVVSKTSRPGSASASRPRRRRTGWTPTATGTWCCSAGTTGPWSLSGLWVSQWCGSWEGRPSIARPPAS
jgi:ABC-type dipeptide/oligopeptide/nickel transport system permease component